MDLATGLPAGERLGRRRCDRVAPTPLPLRRQRRHDEHGDAPQRWAIPVHVRIGDAETDVAARRRRRVRSPSPRPIAAGRRQRRRPRLLPCRLHRRTPRPSRRRRRSPRCPRSSATTSSTTPGRPRWPAACRPPNSSRSSRRSSPSATTPSGRRSSSPARSRSPVRRRRRTRCVPGPVSAHWRRPALDELGEPTADESDLTSKLRGLLVGRVGVLGGDVGAQARCREWFDAASADSSTVDPELTAAATSVVAATGDADDVRADARPVPHRAPRRRSSCVTCTRSPSSTTKRSSCRTCEFAISAAVRRRRMRRSCCARRSPTVVTAPRRGRSSATTGQRHTTGSRATRSCGWSTSIKLLSTTGAGRRHAGVLRRAPDRPGRQDARSDPRTPAGEHPVPDPRDAVTDGHRHH